MFVEDYGKVCSIYGDGMNIYHTNKFEDLYSVLTSGLNADNNTITLHFFENGDFYFTELANLVKNNNIILFNVNCNYSSNISPAKIKSAILQHLNNLYESSKKEGSKKILYSKIKYLENF